MAIIGCLPMGGRNVNKESIYPEGEEKGKGEENCPRKCPILAGRGPLVRRGDSKGEKKLTLTKLTPCRLLAHGVSRRGGVFFFGRYRVVMVLIVVGH